MLKRYFSNLSNLNNTQLRAEMLIFNVIRSKKYTPILDFTNHKLESDVQSNLDFKKLNEKTLVDIIVLKEIIVHEFLISSNISKSENLEHFKKSINKLTNHIEIILFNRFGDCSKLVKKGNTSLTLLLKLICEIIETMMENHAFINIRFLVTSEPWTTGCKNKRTANIYFSKILKKVEKINDVKKASILSLIDNGVETPQLTKLTILFQIFFNKDKKEKGSKGN